MHQEESNVCQDRISALPDDLLIQILSEAPIRDAVTTMLLSKRWRFLWTMMPKLDYTDSFQDKKSIWNYLNKSWQYHKAPLLETVRIKLVQPCPVEPDVGKWVLDAVERCIRNLKLDLFTLSRPKILPACLYTCKTLVSLSLFRNILVDVPSSACLPKLQTLELNLVAYKNQDSHVRLLSGCHVLKDLLVFRRFEDNMTSFSVRVSSLERLTYKDFNYYGRSLVIDSPGLRNLKIDNILKDYCYFHHMPCLVELKVSLLDRDNHWLESLMHVFANSPKLKVLLIDTIFTLSGNFPISCNQPSYVPECLLSHLEIFEWKAYKGTGEDKKLMAYILANSKCLKTVRFTAGPFCKANENVAEKRKMMMKELESMYKVSASCQLIF